MAKVIFKPWIGKNYESGGIFGKRILVLGESHHCGGSTESEAKDAEEHPDFTIDVVTQLLSGAKTRWTPTFRKFERSLVGHETDLEASVAIWNSVAFYNYLQKAMTDPRKVLEWPDDDNDEAAFFEVIDRLQPDLIIVWGVGRMYDNMPSKGWEKGEEMLVDGYSVKNGYYTLDNGKRVRTIWVNHPSTGYSWERWNKVIKEVL